MSGDVLDAGTPVGLVPVEGRGSLPYALLHGHPLVALATWTLHEAGVEPHDFHATWADVQAHGSALVVHDPLCPGTPAAFLAEAVRVCAEREAVVVGTRPVTDTVRSTEGNLVGDSVDRSGLLAVVSPVVLPPRVVAALPALPPVEDLADLVTVLAADHEVVFLEAPPMARRISDESDLRLVESML